MNKRFSIITLSSFILGAIGGLFFPKIMLSISFLGDIYINLLKLMIIPILFFGILSALIADNRKEVSKTTIKTILIFIAMFIVSFGINSLLVFSLKPGLNFNFEIVEWTGSITDFNLKTFITSIFTTNIIDSMSNNSILPVILFAFFFGFTYNHIYKSSDTSLNILKSLIFSLKTVFDKMLEYIMLLTPIGVFSLIGNTTALYGFNLIKKSLLYIGCAWLGCLIIAILVMILPVWLYCKINPIQYIHKVCEIWIMTLSTCSSAATLPNTIKVCNEKFDIPKEITNIVVPLGCTIHMCGGAVSFSLLAIFNAQMFGIVITPMMFLLMLLAALLINMGAPGIPGGGIVLGASYLSLLGIPLDFIGFYAGIYRLLDMPYTTMNVTGDITANCIINESLK